MTLKYKILGLPGNVDEFLHKAEKKGASKINCLMSMNTERDGLFAVYYSGRIRLECDGVKPCYLSSSRLGTSLLDKTNREDMRKSLLGEIRSLRKKATKMGFEVRLDDWTFLT